MFKVVIYMTGVLLSLFVYLCLFWKINRYFKYIVTSVGLRKLKSSQIMTVIVLTKLLANQLPFFFFQLPYYIDGDVKITQSNAILKHIARKHKLGKHLVHMCIRQVEIHVYTCKSGNRTRNYTRQSDAAKQCPYRYICTSVPSWLLFENCIRPHCCHSGWNV